MLPVEFDGTASPNDPAKQRNERRYWRQLAEQRLSRRQVVPALEALNSLFETGAAEGADWLLAGNTLLHVREYAQAKLLFEEGLSAEPEHAELRYGLATALFQLGQVSAAVKHYRTVAERTNHRQAWITLATIAPGDPDIDLAGVLQLRRQLAQQLSAEADRFTPPPGRVYQPGGIIRVGYLSAFFHRANYMKPVWELINGHRRDRFGLVLFADDLPAQGLDWFRPGHHDRVVLTTQLDNVALIQAIREASLDLLVDLNGYSVPARLPVLNARLARVGVAWFNMYATSGLAGIDVIVGDDHVVYLEEEPFYSEKVRRLPQSYLSFVVGHQAPEIVPPPCTLGHPFTFGSLVSQYKITARVLDAWAEILRQAPHSRLLLANRALAASCNRDYVLNEFVQRGIEASRVLLRPPAEHFTYLKYYNEIDLALDAFPYNGGTTTMESLWQGVPTLTFAGDRWASRTSTTLLKNCGMDQFVASDVAGYVEMAVQWATDADAPDQLGSLRAGLREQLATSPVCSMPTMIEAMESLYSELHNTFQRTL